MLRFPDGYAEPRQFHATAGHSIYVLSGRINPLERWSLRVTSFTRLRTWSTTWSRFLASDALEYVTGQMLLVDGGFTTGATRAVVEE